MVFIHVHSAEYIYIYIYITGQRSALHGSRGPLCYTGLLSVKRIGPKITPDCNSGE